MAFNYTQKRAYYGYARDIMNWVEEAGKIELYILRQRDDEDSISKKPQKLAVLIA
jgi:hypothetical protein